MDVKMDQNRRLMCAAINILLYKSHGCFLFLRHFHGCYVVAEFTSKAVYGDWHIND